MPAPALAVVRRGEQPLDGPFKSAIKLVERRRQAREIEREPAKERCGIGLRRGCKSLSFESREDKAIDFVPRPIGSFHVGHIRPHRCGKRPVRRVLGSFGDPLLEQLLLGCGKFLLASGGGIRSDSSAERIRRTSSLASGLPGTMAAVVLSPPFDAPSSSSRRPPSRCAASLP